MQNSRTAWIFHQLAALFVVGRFFFALAAQQPSADEALAGSPHYRPDHFGGGKSGQKSENIENIRRFKKQ